MLVSRLLSQKARLVFGLVALGAAMPEASVDEDGDLLLGKRKVGLSRQRKMPSPVGDLALPQQRELRILRLLVSLPFWPDVSHPIRAPDKSHVHVLATTGQQECMGLVQLWQHLRKANNHSFTPPR